MKKDAEQIGVWGCRGSGKTTRQSELIGGKRRVIVLDPMDSFNVKGYRRVRSIKAMLQAIKAGWNTGFHLIFPTPADETACAEVMRDVVNALFAVQKPYKDNMRGMAGREITLVIDEADLFMPNKPLSGEAGAAIANLCRRGRHYGIETLAASQRLAQVSTTFRGNCSAHYFFAQGDHNDVSAALSIIGTQNRAALLGLRPHEYLFRSMTAGASIQKGRNVAKFR